MSSEIPSTEGAHATDRYQRHKRAAGWLEGVSDEDLLELLPDQKLLEDGHAAVRLPLGTETIFVKLVPITALELAPQNRGTTANVFGLPVHYQYRIGGCGFGAWRELDVHRLANEWVLSGLSARFPLLHHWRILPIARTGYDDKKNLEHWGDCPEIHERVLAIDDARSLALFLEHMPLTLSQWFQEQMRLASDPAALVTATEGKLIELLAFIHGHGLLHMDAHFDNLLTDGNQLYLADYGLSLSRGFELGPDEQAFFDEHKNFDLCTATNSLVHAVVTHYDSRADWRQTLREVEAGNHDIINAAPDGIRSFLVARAPLALAVGEFYERLLADLTTAYPASSFDKLLAGFA